MSVNEISKLEKDYESLIAKVGVCINFLETEQQSLYEESANGLIIINQEKKKFVEDLIMELNKLRKTLIENKAPIFSVPKEITHVSMLGSYVPQLTDNKKKYSETLLQKKKILELTLDEGVFPGHHGTFVSKEYFEKNLAAHTKILQNLSSKTLKLFQEKESGALLKIFNIILTPLSHIMNCFSNKERIASIETESVKKIKRKL